MKLLSTAAVMTGLAISQAAVEVKSATLITSGGSLGTQLTPGPRDIDGDGIFDVNFTVVGPFGFLDRIGSFGLTGNIGGAPGLGFAWVRNTSTIVPNDGVGRDEIIDFSRGAVLNSTDNWSKVFFSRGSGWVQWSFGASTIAAPLSFVLEDPGENLSAAQAASVPGPLPLLGVGAAFGYSRRLRRRMRLGHGPVSTAAGTSNLP